VSKHYVTSRRGGAFSCDILRSTSLSPPWPYISVRLLCYTSSYGIITSSGSVVCGYANIAILLVVNITTSNATLFLV
jgi:hypothetical protein